MDEKRFYDLLSEAVLQLQRSVFLTKYASHVTILIRGEDFSCAETVAKAAKEHPKITVLTQTEVVKVSGKDTLESIIYRDKKTGEETTFAPENDTLGVFVFAGYEPASELIKGMVELTEQGYIVTDENQKTSVDGIYAAVAATSLEKYVVSMQKKNGLVPRKPEAVAHSDNSKDSASDEIKNSTVDGFFCSGCITTATDGIFTNGCTSYSGITLK